MGLLPPSTNADYLGARISVWWLGLAALLTLAPGLIHSFLPDGGAGVIAHLDMGDRRELVIGTFRWEGATQLAYGLILLAGAIRYQALTPFLLLTLIVERGLMALQGWVFSPPASGHHPPEHYASVVAVALSLLFLALSLRRRRG
jgi:MYXO-CTERM domain-containing protein